MSAKGGSRATMYDRAASPGSGDALHQTPGSVFEFKTTVLMRLETGRRGDPLREIKHALRRTLGRQRACCDPEQECAERPGRRSYGRCRVQGPYVTSHTACDAFNNLPGTWESPAIAQPHMSVGSVVRVVGLDHVGTALLGEDSETSLTVGATQSRPARDIEEKAGAATRLLAFLCVCAIEQVSKLHVIDRSLMSKVPRNSTD